MEQPALPKDGQFISSSLLSGSELLIRLVPEIVGRADGSAFVVTAREPKAPEAVLEALKSLRLSEGCVYLLWREGRLVVSGEDEGEVEIEAKEFSAEPAELSAVEFREALAFWNNLYENADEFGKRVRARLQRVQALSLEQLRRTSVKAAGHTPESAAGVLYSQQVEFLHRLLRAAEDDDA